MRTTRIALVAAVLGLAACGGGDTPDAASCTKSWNSAANATQQSTLAGVRVVDVLVADNFRVGTWPKGERKVTVTKGFSDRAHGREATVGKNACVVLLPDSRMGQMAFVEADDGKWGFVVNEEAKGPKETFPDDALKAIAGARNVKPDVLGKLALGS
jgi:hypothetical protein